MWVGVCAPAHTAGLPTCCPNPHRASLPALSPDGQGPDPEAPTTDIRQKCGRAEMRWGDKGSSCDAAGFISNKVTRYLIPFPWSVSSVWSVQGPQTPVPEAGWGRCLVASGNRRQCDLVGSPAHIWGLEHGSLVIRTAAPATLRARVPCGGKKGLSTPPVEDGPGLCPGASGDRSRPLPTLASAPALASPTPGTGSIAFCASPAVPRALGASLSPHPVVPNRSVQLSTPRREASRPSSDTPRKPESKHV